MIEEWRGLIYQENDYSQYYEISNLGRLRNTKTHKILKQTINKTGYYGYCGSLGNRQKKKMFKIHKAVAETFIPNPNCYKVINHIDGNKLNNKLDNLEWVTQTENMRHAVDVLGNCINDKNGNAKGIQGINKNGDIIYDYNSIAECAKDISRDKQVNYRYVQNSIWRVLNGYRKTYMKLKWIYK